MCSRQKANQAGAGACQTLEIQMHAFSFFSGKTILNPLCLIEDGWKERNTLISNIIGILNGNVALLSNVPSTVKFWLAYGLPFTICFCYLGWWKIKPLFKHLHHFKLSNHHAIRICEAQTSCYSFFVFFLMKHTSCYSCQTVFRCKEYIKCLPLHLFV